MNLHDASLKSRFTRFLARKAAPRHLAEGQPQADEITALVGALRSRAPRDPDALNDWWAGFEAALDERCGRTWPTVKEIQDAARAIAPAPGVRVSEPSERDSAVIMANRMKAGEAVGEGWLYGVLACELIARGLIDRETMDRYRKSAFWNRADVYGQEAAREWEAEAKERHHHGKELWRAREERRQERETRSLMPASKRPAA